MQNKARKPEEFVLVNYCHPDCEPLKNIMRLPEKEAFLLAGQMAKDHPDTTAFGRFADFDNYYALRRRQDVYLRRRFVELGGQPEEEHPLSFVVEGSDYLREWFANGLETRLPLAEVAPEHISFTVGDSGSTMDKTGTVDVLTREQFFRLLDRHGGDLSALLREAGRGYVEAQLWSDKYLK